MEPHMDTIKAAVNRVMGLGVRKDIYADIVSMSSENISDSEVTPSYHRPVDIPRPSNDLNVLLDTSLEEKEEYKEVTEEKAGEQEVRCDFCPDPGMIPLTEKIAHQARLIIPPYMT